MNTAFHDPTSIRPAESSLPNFSVHTVFVAIRCWWHIALPLGLLLGSAAAVVVYYNAKQSYTAQAWVMIKDVSPFILQQVSPQNSQKFVLNQIELMKSPLVLGPVIGDLAVASAPELANHPDPVQYLRDNLRIRSLGGSEYYVIEFTSTSPEKASLIVNRVAQEYRGLQDQHEKQLNYLTITNLQKQQLLHHQDVKRMRANLQELSRKILNQDAFAPRVERAPVRNPLADLESQSMAADVEQAFNKATIESEEELFRRESFEPPPSLVEAQVESLDQVRQVRAKIAADKVKLAQHQEKSANLQSNTLYHQLVKQVNESEAALQKTLVELTAATKAALEQSARAKRQDDIAALHVKQTKLESVAAFLDKRLKERQGDLRVTQGEANSNTLELDIARAEYDRAVNYFDAISNRILALQTELGAPARVEMTLTAKTPTRPDEAVPFKKMGMAGVGALCIPFALAVGIELLFRRVSSRQQLELTGQIAVVAEVTSLPARARGRFAPGLAVQRDRLLFEESVDGLRTYLTLVESMRGRKVLAVTSAISREGKTSLASQLAVSVASATRKPTLLIDGDMRSPDIHRIFDVERGPGLSEVLQGQCQAEEAIEIGFSEHLHLLTAGELNISPHRVLGNGSFADLIKRLGDNYDHIILDTPPILAASEALLMASVADSAILCVRRDFSRIDQVADAFARLRSAGVKTAGAVLNGIPARHYAYRYGTYYNTHANSRSGRPGSTSGLGEPRDAES